MRVSHLSLADFRNYERAELGLEPGANLIVGRNGQGKTNLVEAVGYFASLSSHRTSNDAPLVRQGRESAIARMRLEAAGRTAQLEIEIQRHGANRAQVNGNTVRPRELLRWFSSVAFTPEDLAIVRGEPSVRRRFLDEALIARHPAAAGVLADYDRVVRQRTALLKSARANGARGSIVSTLSVWDDQLVRFGAQIMEARRSLVADLRGPLADSYHSLVDQDHQPSLGLAESVAVSRETSVTEPRLASEASVSRETLEQEYREALAEVRDRELERGVTLVGPHRDDLDLSLNGLPVKGYASHGESWSFALAIKLALAEILRSDSAAGDPVIILDDVFAELDATRRARLMDAVKGYEQVIVTAAVEDDIPRELAWHRTEIEAGEIVEAKHG